MMFKAGGANYNTYREKILGDVCMQAFGSTHPTKEGVFLSHGAVIARTFARGTQSRADLIRSLQTVAQELLEQHGPTMLSTQQLDVLRATSVKRGVSKVAAGPRRSPSCQRVTLKSVTRDAAAGSHGFAPVPKRSRPTTRSLAPGRRWQAVATAGAGEDEHLAIIREGKEQASRHERAQVVAAAIPASPPPLPPPSTSPRTESTSVTLRKSNKILALAGSVAIQAAQVCPTYHHHKVILAQRAKTTPSSAQC